MNINLLIIKMPIPQNESIRKKFTFSTDSIIKLLNILDKDLNGGEALNILDKFFYQKYFKSPNYICVNSITSANYNSLESFIKKQPKSSDSPKISMPKLISNKIPKIDAVYELDLSKQDINLIKGHETNSQNLINKLTKISTKQII